MRGVQGRTRNRQSLKGTEQPEIHGRFATVTTSAETVRLRRRIGLESGGPSQIRINKTAAVQTSPFLRPFWLRGRLLLGQRLGLGILCRPGGWLGGRRGRGLLRSRRSLCLLEGLA